MPFIYQPSAEDTMLLRNTLDEERNPPVPTGVVPRVNIVVDPDVPPNEAHVYQDDELVGKIVDEHAPTGKGERAAHAQPCACIDCTPMGAHPQDKAGMKFDQDKPRMDLLDPTAMLELSKVLTFGASKYAAHNWRKGLSKTRLLAAALRHLFAYLGGQDKDPETGLSHAAHAMCCCMFILGLEHRPDLDDRFKEATQP